LTEKLFADFTFDGTVPAKRFIASPAVGAALITDIMVAEGTKIHILPVGDIAAVVAGYSLPLLQTDVWTVGVVCIKNTSYQ